MKPTTSHQRLIENQAVFREHNERIKQNFDDLAEVAKDSGQEYLVKTDDTALYFMCECSDESCRRRIQMKPSLYEKVHKRRNRFIIIAGHEIDAIEQVVNRHDDYIVVEKYLTPPEHVRTLKAV